MRFGLGRTERMSESEATLLLERLAVLSEADLPLVSGLQNAAAEVSDDALRDSMLRLADRLEQGERSETVLHDQLSQCPANLRGAIAAALNSGEVSEVLSAFISQQQVRRDLLRAIRNTFAYPSVLLALCLALIIVFSIFIQPGLGLACASPFGGISGRGQFVNWWSQSGVWYLMGAIGFLAVVAVLARCFLGAAHWHRLKNWLPLIGPLHRWLGIVEWTRMTSLFLHHRMPLPQAVRWASQSAVDTVVRQQGSWLASDITDGQRLSDALESRRVAPGMLHLLVRWGEESEDLPAALETSADYFEERVRRRIAVLRVTLPPFVFVFIALVVLTLFGAVVASIWGSMLRNVWWW